MSLNLVGIMATCTRVKKERRKNINDILDRIEVVVVRAPTHQKRRVMNIENEKNTNKHSHKNPTLNIKLRKYLLLSSAKI